MDKIEAPDSTERQVTFRFPQPERSGRKVMELKGVDHAYGQTVVYQGLDYTVERNQRTVLVGPNGAGKSTLLKLLAGVLPFRVDHEKWVTMFRSAIVLNIASIH